MMVCLCEGISDREVSAVVRDGARSVEEVGRRCGAGTGCGGCHEVIEGIVERHAPRPCRVQQLLARQGLLAAQAAG